MNRAQRRNSGGKELVLPNGVPVTNKADAPPTVGIGYCHPSTWIAPQFHRSLVHLLVADGRRVHAGRAMPTIVKGEYMAEASGVHVPDARCDIVRQFLADPARPQWLFMVDSDASFGVTIIDQLLSVADAKERPIIGALAFGVSPTKDENGVEQFNAELASEPRLFPTLYFFDEEGQVHQWLNYPLNECVPVHSTGCHAFLVHRSVLADERWTADGHPLPWFRVAVHNGAVMSEDQFFFARAGSFGYLTHVDTSVKTGHVKTYVADEEMYLRQERAPIIESLASAYLDEHKNDAPIEDDSDA